MYRIAIGFDGGIFVQYWDENRFGSPSECIWLIPGTELED